MKIDTGAVIGSVDPTVLAAEALHWHGGHDPYHLPSWRHPRLRAASEELAGSAGGLVVCSGGTTGSPKMTVMAPDLGVPRVAAHWRPLGPGDVLLNLFPTGKMWGAQYFYNAFALHSRSMVAPMGALGPDEFDEWSGKIADLGVTALAGAPNTLARFAELARASGFRPEIRAAIWSGEPMTAARQASIHAAFPDAGLWGNYGAAETFVIGVSRPDCDLGAIHLLPGQLLEPHDDGALLTRVGDGWPVPVVRFRLGDCVRPVTCSCGDGDGFTVTARADDNLKVHGAKVGTSHALDVARASEGVDEAQLVVYHDPEVPSAVVGLRMLVTGAAVDPAAVRREMVGTIEDLQIIDGHSPAAFVVEHVSDVERNQRTNKVLPVVRRSADELVRPGKGGIA